MRTPFFDEVGLGGKLLAICALTVAHLSFAALTLLFSVAIIKGEIAGNAWAGSLGFGIPALGSGWMLFRLLRGRRSANGVTMMPTWFFSAFGILLAILIALTVMASGQYWFLTLFCYPMIWFLVPIMIRRRLKEEVALFGQIRQALSTGAIQFLESLAQARPGERVYAFLFEISLFGERVSAVAATEEGLARLVQQYVAMGYRTEGNKLIERLRQWLRWQEPEATFYTRAEGWYTNYEADTFDSADLLIRSGLERGYLARRRQSDTLIRLCLETLQEMDTVGIFAQRVERTQLVLGILCHGKDFSDEMFLSMAAQVNPPSVMDRLQSEIQDKRAVAQTIVVPPEETEGTSGFPRE